ncbi:hypothetical protein BS47DRAFT_1352467 [Hydnum rufescens UP504]|uniref:Uncharacterized protein n=1 Tax=Hydnum rufescens UP504 TaxID=1448309 RepID=A0A9P6AJ75_9AGAM|nr:hypothetical protein BS47DRAFT_1352467 [Hydnum rufescens UP504]
MALVNDPWSGPERIVLGVDLGTVFSAVAYSYLYPGSPRSITSVCEWPDQRNASEPRVPTLLWYDRHKPAKCGASALIPDATQAKEKGWQLAKLFKLHLHPQTMKSEHTFETSDLPDGVTLSQIYSDYLAYLVEHTRHFFEGHVLEGTTVWTKHFQSADIIITHPNGWGVREQHFLRNAAIARIRFLTDAEACVHFCLLNGGFGSDWLKRGVQFAICDAGGSTVDITTYEVTRTEPSLLLKETRASASVPAGAIFVARAAQRDSGNSDKAAYAEFGEPFTEPHEINMRDLIENAQRMIQKTLLLLAKVLRILEQIIRILENAIRLENELAQEGAATSLNYEVTEESVASEGEISLSSLSKSKEKVLSIKNDSSLDVPGDLVTGKGENEPGPIEGAMSMSPDEAKVINMKNEPVLEAARNPPNGEVPKESQPPEGAISTFPSNGNEAQASGIQNSAPGGADSSPESESSVEVVPIKGVIDGAASFDPYVDMIVAALKKADAASEIKRIFLVGGFSKSQYLCRKLIAEMAKENRQITAAEGAAILGTQPRLTVYSYGTDMNTNGRRIHRWADGMRSTFMNAWSAVVARFIQDPTKRVKCLHHVYYRTGNPQLRTFSKAPRFMRDPEGRSHARPHTHRLPGLRSGFMEILAACPEDLERRIGAQPAHIWVLNFSIGIEFGGVELQAYVEWVEKGIKKRGGVSILPSQD